MAVYLCSRCDGYIDGDHIPCVEDPKGKNFEVMCCDHEEEEYQNACDSCGHGEEHHKHADACRFDTCQCKRFE